MIKIKNRLQKKSKSQWLMMMKKKILKIKKMLKNQKIVLRKNIQKTQEKLKEKIKNIEQKDEEMGVSDMADLLNIDVDVKKERGKRFRY